MPELWACPLQRRKACCFVVDVAAQLLTRLFQILHGSAGTGFLENADRFVCGVLCFTQNIPRFFIRFAQDTVPRLVDFIVFLL